MVGTAFKLRKRKKNSPPSAHVLHKALNLAISLSFFYIAEDGKEMYRNSYVRAEPLFCSINPSFVAFSCHRPNRLFPSCFEPHYGSEAKCKVFVMKSSFHSYSNKTNFHMESFALSLAFIVRFTATRKWPIVGQRDTPDSGGRHLATFSTLHLTAPQECEGAHSLHTNLLKNGHSTPSSSFGTRLRKGDTRRR